MKKKFFITTPIYYVNAKPHIGHAYTTVAADILARFHRLQGNDVFLLTGTDEHGLKIQREAEKKGKKPQEFVEEISAEFRDLWEKLGIQYDYFIRTTDPSHKKAVQKVLRTLYEKKAVYKGEYEGLYCVACEQFWQENELINGRCPDHNIVLEKVKEECYLLKLSDVQSKLIEKIESDEFAISPERYKKEILSFLKSQPLKDISISRKNVSWGIPLPFDSEHTTYVWIDAFLNYLTGIGWDGNVNFFQNLTFPLPERSSRNSSRSDFSNFFFWPPDVQLIGKDILRVHATIWPAILMHLGIPLPKMLYVHGHIRSGGRKMSKTLGNVISIEEMLEKFGRDGTRYLLMSAGTFGEDVDITIERMVEKYNADLANGLSNLIYRTLSILEKNGEEKVPKTNIVKAGEIFRVNRTLYSGLAVDMEDYFKISEDVYKNINYSGYLKLNKILELVMIATKKLNGLIEETKLWELKKNNLELYNYFSYILLESFRLLAWLLLPLIPGTSENIFSQLGIDVNKEKGKGYKERIRWGGLIPGTKLGEKKIIFKSKK